LLDILADGDLVDYGEILAIDLSTLLSGIPKCLAPEIKFPDPLPGPLHTVVRAVPLEPVDYCKLPPAECTKLENKRQIKVKHLPLADQTVVSATINRMGCLLSTCFAFPDESTCWTLANMANDWVCRKYGQNLALTEQSEYKTLVSNPLSHF
jgi:hypothetical protein